MADEIKQYNEFVVGDLITAYEKGIWKIERIERRFYTKKDIDNYGCYKDKKVGEEYNRS